MKPIIGLTMGDPGGVGPELILKSLSKKTLFKKCHPIIFGDLFQFIRLQNKTHHPQIKKISFEKINSVNANIVQKSLKKGLIPIMDFGFISKNGIPFGKAHPLSGKASGHYILEGAKSALLKQIDALVTLPINKYSFKLGGWGKKFKGHTDMLAELTQSKSVAMMLMVDQFRSVQVTSHIPLKEVPKNITVKKIIETARLTHKGLKNLGVKNPRLAVSGLNPHAGDQGILGMEEEKIIGPAVQNCRRMGMNIKGPFSPDIIWPWVKEGQFDAGIAMYHDQGQIPIKMVGWKSDNKGGIKFSGTNYTLGIPFIRTSVAHGSAFDIAGQFKCSEASLLNAIDVAIQLAKNSND